MKKPNNNTIVKRVKALKQYKIVDTLPEKEYDDISRLAALMCNTPIALITLLDEKRQFFKSHYGLDINETPIAHSFCTHAIKKPADILIIEDTRKDERFKDNSLVVSKPNIAFYAGVPLINEDNVALGTLCVLDVKPNKLNSEQITSLQALANQIMQLLILRKKNIEISENKKIIDEETIRLKNIVEATHIGTWEWNFETGEIKINEYWANIIGYTLKELQPINEKTIYQFIHPDDIELVDKKLNDYLKRKSAFYDVDFRLKHKKGNYIWINERGKVLKCTAKGEPLLMTVTHTDITERKEIKHQLEVSNQRFQLVIQATTDCVWDLNPLTNELFLGDSFNRNFGIEIQSLQENNDIINARIHPADFSKYIKSFKNTLNGSKDTSWAMKYRIRKSNGEYAYVSDRAKFLRDKKGKAYRVVGAIKDITQEYFHEQLESIEREVMTLSMQENAKIEQVVSTYLLKLEHLFPSMKASVMKVENNKLYNLASPSLPKEYVKTLNAVSIGKYVSSCGAAAFTKEKVIVENVFKDKRWEKYLHLPKKYKFAACWSQPIFDSKGNVMATFTNYYNTPRKPNQQEEEAIDRAQRLLSVLLSKFKYIENIKESNERFELVYKATNDAIYDWDVEQDQIYWGDGFYNTLGYEKTDGIFKLKDWAELTHPMDRAKDKQSWASFLKDERRQKWMNEFRFRKADGTYLYMEGIGHLIRNKKGKPVRMIGALRNVSKSKLSEAQKLIQHQVATNFKDENILSIIVDNTLKYITEYGEYATAEIWLKSNNKSQLNLMSIYAADKKGQAYFNQTKEITCFKLGEGLPGKVWEDLKITILEEINVNPKFLRNSSAKKSELKAVVGFPLFHNNSFVGVMVLTSRDSLKNDLYRTEIFAPLSNFLGAEIKRKQQEDDLKLFFNSSPDILTIASPDGYFVKANPAFTEILGYTEEEIVFQPFKNFLHPDDTDDTIKEYNETITGGRRAQGFTNRYRTKSGSYKWISWNSSDVFGEDDFVFAYGRDVTEMKELQQLLINTSRLAKVGSWEIDVKKNSVYWSGITKEIREVEPDFKPTLNNGISGFVDGDRAIINKRVEQCKKDGTSWDEELRIITNKGNLKWVRTIGKAEFIDGECVKIYGSFQDIHEKKLNEIALKQGLKTLEDYKFSLDQSAIIAITDKKGIITSVNDNFCKISQYSRKELIGKTHQLINSNYHPKSFFDGLWKTISSGKVWRGEVKNLAKDGTYYWVDTTIVPFLDEKNKPFQYLAIRFNITDRILAKEKALSSLEERNIILESIGDAFFAVDKKFIVTYWNRVAEQMTNTTREKIIGKNLWDLFSKETGKISYKNYTRAMKTMKTIHFEDYHASLGKWFDLSVYPTKGGLAVYMKDITEKKIAEEQIRQSNERFEKVTEATNDAIWDWDIINNQLYLGKGYTTLFGYDVIKNSTSLETWAGRVHPDDADIVLKSLDGIIKDPNSINWQQEYRYKKKNGEYSIVIDRGVIIRDEKGKAIRMVGSISDVSNQKKHEESLNKLNIQLLRHTNELKRSNEELEQFAYIASHDLQEPLRMVTSFLSQLEKKYSNQLDEKAHTYINFAVDGASRMRNIILDLLEFSRVGKNNDELESINITEIVEQVNVLLRKVIEEKEATITFQNLPTIMAYRSPIIQVFQNLISNGLKYAKADIAPIIEISAKELKSEWQFAIKDNGIGIKKDYYEKIFVIFQRLHHKEEYSGTGMGLAIVKKTIENFGGKIWLESEEENGTTFYFTIPKKNFKHHN